MRKAARRLVEKPGVHCKENERRPLLWGRVVSRCVHDGAGCRLTAETPAHPWRGTSDRRSRRCERLPGPSRRGRHLSLESTIRLFCRAPSDETRGANSKAPPPLLPYPRGHWRGGGSFLGCDLTRRSQMALTACGQRKAIFVDRSELDLCAAHAVFNLAAEQCIARDEWCKAIHGGQTISPTARLM